MNKSLFLERLQRERDQFELLLNRVGFMRRLTVRGVLGSLSIKDLLADILSREQFIADRLNEILHGEVYAATSSFTMLENFQSQFGVPDYESPLINKDRPLPFVMEKYKNIALDEIVSQELAVYTNIIDALQKLTHHRCLDHDLFHRIAEHTYKSYRRTSGLINRWLKKIAAQSK
ncbi:MAG: hypothetical protein HC797_02265 [Anaerolineales bacterium]|nr:hypothetical protein [Anaerolineales bacterium]